MDLKINIAYGYTCVVTYLTASASAMREAMKAAILMVSANHMLSYSRVKLLKKWKPVSVSPRDAPEAMAAKIYELLIICQTVPDDIAATLALQMKALHPAAKVLSIKPPGQCRPFDSLQYVVDVRNLVGLPNYVDSILGATAS